MNKIIETIKVKPEETGNNKAIFAYFIILVTMIILMLAPIVSAEEPVQLASIQGYGSSVMQQNYLAAEEDKPEGIDAATCKTFGKIQAAVEGPTELEFWWKGSDTGVLTFYVNGKAESVMIENTGWQILKFSVKNSGTHTISWEYKDQDRV